MEDPLPDGPWDLVVAVLSVHHLDAEGKRDLFRRVREQSRALVIGDVVEVAERRGRRSTRGVDFPDAPTDLAEWCDGEIVWQDGDLAVIRPSTTERSERASHGCPPPSEPKPVLYEKRDRIACVTINRPEARTRSTPTSTG